MNVEFPPLCNLGPRDGQKLVLEIIPPGQLHHIKLNPTNHILDTWAALWPGLRDWIQVVLNVLLEPYHGEKYEGENNI